MSMVKYAIEDSAENRRRARCAVTRVDRATARAIAEIERELERIWADFDQGRLTRREAEIEHDRAIAGWAREP